MLPRGYGSSLTACTLLHGGIFGFPRGPGQGAGQCGWPRGTGSLPKVGPTQDTHFFHQSKTVQYTGMIAWIEDAQSTIPAVLSDTTGDVPGVSRFNLQPPSHRKQTPTLCRAPTEIWNRPCSYVENSTWPERWRMPGRSVICRL